MCFLFPKGAKAIPIYRIEKNRLPLFNIRRHFDESKDQICDRVEKIEKR